MSSSKHKKIGMLSRYGVTLGSHVTTASRSKPLQNRGLTISPRHSSGQPPTLAIFFAPLFLLAQRKRYARKRWESGSTCQQVDKLAAR